MNTTHPFMIEPRYGSTQNIYLTYSDKQKIKDARQSGEKMVEIDGNEIQVDYRPIVRNPKYSNPLDELEYKIQNMFYQKFKRMTVIDADVEPADPAKFTKYFLLKYYKDSDEYRKRDNLPSGNPAFARFIDECKSRGLYNDWREQAKNRVYQENPDLVERINREKVELANCKPKTQVTVQVKKTYGGFWED